MNVNLASAPNLVNGWRRDTLSWLGSQAVVSLQVEGLAAVHAMQNSAPGKELLLSGRLILGGLN